MGGKAIWFFLLALTAVSLGTATGYVSYQEDADSHSFSDSSDHNHGYIWLNYTKPADAVGATWQVKHSNLNENITIPSSCWNHYDDKVYLSVDSYVSTNLFVSQYSQPKCYDGSWVDIGSSGGLGGGGSTCAGKMGNGALAYDGDWGTYVACTSNNGPGVNGNYWCNSGMTGNTQAAIVYEERIWWGYPPAMTIGSAQDTIIIATSHTFSVSLEETGNCTLHLDGADYVNSTSGTGITWPMTLDEGNHSVSYTCEDAYGNAGDSETYWLYVAICGNGDTEPGEECDGNDACCNQITCKFKSAGTECRTSAGVCDTAETCTGSSADCPADTFKASSVVCRTSAGVCDTAETCTGSSADCPDNAKSTAVCRASAGICDIAESCDGSSNDCPADEKTTDVCRTSAGVCDVAESCDGAGNDCPADDFQPLGTSCEDGLWCNGNETCDGLGICAAGTPVNCSDADYCTADACNETSDSCECTGLDLCGNDVCDCGETCDSCPGDCGACPDAVKKKAIETENGNSHGGDMEGYFFGSGSGQPQNEPAAGELSSDNEPTITQPSSTGFTGGNPAESSGTESQDVVSTPSPTGAAVGSGEGPFWLGFVLVAVLICGMVLWQRRE